ncbi:MAG TPA: fasciclin domain-containing protein [Pyrinomonadaceae bacterium]|nr:fasciclin domain-containing protein [Pyrinomonadaceae bacterium]
MLKLRIRRILAATALGLAAAASFTTGVPTRAAAETTDVAAATATTGDIVETAVGAGTFKTLSAALEAAGLIEALKGRGPFTVFAPTDEAFAKLPAGTVEELLKPENREKLKAVLLYHVVPGKVVAADVLKLDGKEAKTLQGGKVKVRAAGGVMVDRAKVVKTDVMATNGVIHVIDTVLMPGMDRGRMD